MLRVMGMVEKCFVRINEFKKMEEMLYDFGIRYVMYSVKVDYVDVSFYIIYLRMYFIIFYYLL